MSYKFKRLTNTNLKELKQLRLVFAEAFAEKEAYSKIPSNEYLESILSDPKCIILVAVDIQNLVVGGIVAYELCKIEIETSEVYLYDLAVEKEHRRKGIATQLILNLKAVAKEINAKIIFVQADNEDVEAVALYTKLSSVIEKDITHFDISTTI
jgi:aminoglycoside 3-N-acetyltransferase I